MSVLANELRIATLPLFHRHKPLDILTKNGDALGVLSSLRDDEIGVTLGGLNELFVHGLQHLQVSVYNHRHRAASGDGISLYVANETFIGVAINKDFQVHHLPQPLIDERHDSLDDDDGLRLHMYGLG